MKEEVIAFCVLVTASLPGIVSANRIFETEIDDLLILFRYLIGLAFTVFGIFFLLYKDYATKIFLQFYENAEIVSASVVACNTIQSGRYQVKVVFSAASPKTLLQPRGHVNPTGAGDALLQQEYMLKYDSLWLTPQGTRMDLYLIPGKPRSAITKDLLDSGRESFSWTKALSILVPGLMLVVVFISLCIDIINNFPPGSQWTGWIAFVIGSGWIVLASWSFCEYQFQDYAKMKFLSAFPVQRRDSNGNIVPPPLAMPTPTTSPVPESMTEQISSTSAVATDLSSIREPEGAYYNADMV